MKKLFTALIFLFSFCSIVHAKEYIDTYHVDITVLDNGNISVTENIKVWAEGKDIKRGIYRWFPLKNVEKYQRSVPYMNLRVTRNGQPEKIGKTERKSDSIAYYLSDKDVFIETNTFHDYAISYEVDKAILQFDESDQLYWNIIPFFWEFPISNISAKVKFPENANYLGVELFSGAFGSKTNGLNVSYLETNDGISFQGREFERAQGLTARIKFEPSLVPASENYPIINDAYRKAEKDAQERRIKEEEARFEGEAVGFILGALVFLFLTIATWYRLGRKTLVVPTIYPQFYPPKNISPLAARYILRQGNVDKVKMMTIALVSLASKGILELNRFTIARVSDSDESATPGEKLLLRKMGLSENGNLFNIKRRSETWAADVRDAASELVAFAEKEFGENIIYNWEVTRSMLLVLAVVLFSFLIMTGNGLFIPVIIILCVFTTVLTFIGIGYKYPLYPISILAIFGIIALIMNITLRPMVSLLYFIGFLIILVALYVLFAKMKNYSTSGGKAVSQLEGLKMYILAAEHQMFEDEPEPSGKQFTEIYPYAFAMGLHMVWADKFSKELAEWASVSNAGTDWYSSDNSNSSDNFENSFSSFETDFSEAANYTPPSSSGSGGDGGGGGGDGGGGGGGGGD